MGRLRTHYSAMAALRPFAGSCVPADVLSDRQAGTELQIHARGDCFQLADAFLQVGDLDP